MEKIAHLIQGKIGLFLKNLIGDFKFDYQYDSISFTKMIGKENFVLKLHINDGDYKYVELSNLLIPSSMKRKGISKEIISLLVSLCDIVNYNFYITQITREPWKNWLLKNGGIEDEVGDVLIKKNRWIENHDSKKLVFVKYGDYLILESEVQQFIDMKNTCTNAIVDIFTSWKATMDVKKSEGSVEQIIADIDNETYFVLFNYNTLNYMYQLLREDQLEMHLKENKSIGLFG